MYSSSLENSTTGIAILQGSKTSDIRKKIREICSNFDKPDDTESETYIDKVDIINECLENTDVNITNLIEDLGNDVAALGSVPASVYSFLAGKHCSSSGTVMVVRVINTATSLSLERMATHHGYSLVSNNSFKLLRNFSK